MSFLEEERDVMDSKMLFNILTTCFRQLSDLCRRPNAGGKLQVAKKTLVKITFLSHLIKH